MVGSYQPLSPSSIPYKKLAEAFWLWYNLLVGGAWLSLVERSFRVREVGSSNLPAPTIKLKASLESPAESLSICGCTADEKAHQF